MPPEQDSPQPPISQAALDSFGKFLATQGPGKESGMLARTLVGDYGAVSHYGQGLRNKVIPFYSWMEVNAKRYGQLIKNAFDQGIGQGFKTAGLTGAALGTRASVYLGLRMAAMILNFGGLLLRRWAAFGCRACPSLSPGRVGDQRESPPGGTDGVGTGQSGCGVGETPGRQA